MVKLNIEDLNGDNKQKKKAITLYLSEDTFKFVREHLKNQSASSFIDNVLMQAEKFIKEKEEEKERDKSKKD